MWFLIPMACFATLSLQAFAAGPDYAQVIQSCGQRLADYGWTLPVDIKQKSLGNRIAQIVGNQFGAAQPDIQKAKFAVASWIHRIHVADSLLKGKKPRIVPELESANLNSVPSQVLALEVRDLAKIVFEQNMGIAVFDPDLYRSEETKRDTFIQQWNRNILPLLGSKYSLAVAEYQQMRANGHQEMLELWNRSGVTARPLYVGTLSSSYYLSDDMHLKYPRVHAFCLLATYYQTGNVKEAASRFFEASDPDRWLPIDAGLSDFITPGNVSMASLLVGFLAEHDPLWDVWTATDLGSFLNAL